MSMDQAPQSPIPPALKDLLALFEGPLAQVQFPEVDAASLREHAAAVDAAAQDVEAAAAAWAAAKRAVDDRLEALLQKAQRALAYARVYAEDKPELSSALAAVALPRSGEAPRGPKPAAPAEMGVAARKRGRPRKNPAGDAPPPSGEQVITLLSESTETPAAAE